MDANESGQSEHQIVQTTSHSTSSGLSFEGTKNQLKPVIGVVGVPLRYGQNKDGPQRGPDVLRGPLFKVMSRAACSFADNGNIEFMDSKFFGEAHNMYEDHNFGSDGFTSVSGAVGNNSGCGNAMFPKTVASAVYKIEDKVSEVSSNGQFVLTLGGDHAMVMATVEATGKLYKDLVVIHIDAHGDINTIASSESGHIHGAPLSFVVEDEQFQKENAGCKPFKQITPVIKPTNLAFIGLRDLDAFEVDAIHRLNITAFSSADVKEIGARNVVKRLFDAINPKRDRPVHVSFDIDSVDPSFAPSTGTSVVNGLTRDEAIEIASEISKTGTLVALDIAEVNPLIQSDSAGRTVDTAVDVAMAFMSNVCSSQSPSKFRLKGGRRWSA